MKELVELIVQAIVDEPEAVLISEVEGSQSAIIEIRVAPGDMGKVIGKQGRIAKAIRAVTRAAASKQGRRVVVEIVE